MVLKLYLLFVGFVFELKHGLKPLLVIAWTQILGFLSLWTGMTHSNKFKDPNFWFY